ncbi:hypothetical protein [Planococcus soli]|uniref:hypothetical protein n=1 Tax=Planococcus soli TaxID=2666072 RepID=UPI00115CB78B|nr:hypothetical protein [Planococcus soli]
MMNKDKKNESIEEANKEKNEEFTGSPEQQLPDFEAEDKQNQQEEQYQKTARKEKDKASDD